VLLAETTPELQFVHLISYRTEVAATDKITRVGNSARQTFYVAGLESVGGSE
jgi:hypothetical protein